MAIDSQAKRQGAVNPLCPWRSIVPLPDGTVGQPDRQTLALLYPGIAAAAPESFTCTRISPVNFTMPFRACIVIPDGSISQGERQQIALMYCGILAVAAVASSGSSTPIWYRRRRTTT